MKNEKVVRVVSIDTQARNQAIGAHVNTAKSCTFAELYDLFADKSSVGTLEPFRKRMQYLVFSGQLQAAGHRHARVYRPAEAPLPEEPPVLVPPRQVSVMHCGPYVPDRSQALRPGAMDFMRVRSVGVQC